MRRIKGYKIINKCYTRKKYLKPIKIRVKIKENVKR